MTTVNLLNEEKEHSLIIVKPDGYERGLTGEILRRIESKGYKLVGLKAMEASRELLEEHYHEHKEKHFFADLVDYMSSGPVVLVIVEGDRVVEGMRNLIGTTNPTLAAPGTIRGDLGRDWGDDQVLNVVHGSDSPHSAEREIGIWFAELL